MNRSSGWEKFWIAITQDRPWEENEISAEIRGLVAQKDIAEVLYSLLGEEAVPFLLSKNRDFSGRIPVEILRAGEAGEAELSQYLMSNPWL